MFFLCFLKKKHKFFEILFFIMEKYVYLCIVIKKIKDITIKK